jgi:branched-chain amino acid transport system permease protein
MQSANSRGVLPQWLDVAVKMGLIGGIASVLIALEGMVAAFNPRFIIGGVLTMGHALLFISFFVTSYFALTRSHAVSRVLQLAVGAISGLIASALVVLLIAIGTNFDIGSMFINATADLYKILTFGKDPVTGSGLMVLIGLLIGIAAAVLLFLPARPRRLVLIPLGWVITIGLMQDLITTTLTNLNKAFVPALKFFYAGNGLSVTGAIAAFVVIAALYYILPEAGTLYQREAARVPPASRNVMRLLPWGLAVIILLALPSIIGLYLSQVLDDVGLYLLMGLGLNIVVGFAGLLDLGYVAFFAIGAYSMGVLTTPDFGHPALLPFWAAVPLAILAALLAGVILGIPVLNMRGDYLAIVTLGFGEIIRVLAISDFLKPILGGAQGVLDIAKPIVVWVESSPAAGSLSQIKLVHPEQFYYILLAGCLLVAFVATRMKKSRLGRAWMAMREDEDVAQAMGINLVTTKLLAFGMGATFGGLSGAIFASQLGSIFPTSFNFIVSVNVLALIIIGGMGNIPGVVLGALALVGLPELLREFSDYRFLFYGAALVLVMLTRPEGLLPEPTHKLEFEEAREEEAEAAVLAPAPGE